MAAGQLQAACHPGIIEMLYRDRDENYDNEKNVSIVAETVLKILTNEKPVTFAKA
jgi:hypothetical protein